MTTPAAMVFIAAAGQRELGILSLVLAKPMLQKRFHAYGFMAGRYVAIPQPVGAQQHLVHVDRAGVLRLLLGDTWTLHSGNWGSWPARRRAPRRRVQPAGRCTPA